MSPACALPLATMFASVICLREWIKTGARTYRLNHFGISYDSTGHKPGRPRPLLVAAKSLHLDTGRLTRPSSEFSFHLSRVIRMKVEFH